MRNATDKLEWETKFLNAIRDRDPLYYLYSVWDDLFGDIFGGLLT